MTLGEMRALLDLIPREYDGRDVWANDRGDITAIEVDADGVGLLRWPVTVAQPAKSGILVVNRVLLAEVAQ